MSRMKPGKKTSEEEVPQSRILFVDTKPHGANKVINPNDLDKPNILERSAYDECIILNSTPKQLYNKALFNVVRALKKGSKCEIFLESMEDALMVSEEGKIAGFVDAQINKNKVVLTK